MSQQYRKIGEICGTEEVGCSWSVYYTGEEVRIACASCPEDLKQYIAYLSARENTVATSTQCLIPMNACDCRYRGCRYRGCRYRGCTLSYLTYQKVPKEYPNLYSSVPLLSDIKKIKHMGLYSNIRTLSEHMIVAIVTR